MKSIKYLYRIGRGPSSSHTIGPNNAALALKEKYKDNIVFADITLYGSLAFTGRGHRTDSVLIESFSPIPTKVSFDLLTEVEFPNTMKIKLLLKDGRDVEHIVLSLGGGAYSIDGVNADSCTKDVYHLSTFDDISHYCKAKKLSLQEYVYESEGNEIKEYLSLVLKTMMEEVENGLKADGYLPGKLHVKRKAKYFFENVNKDEKENEKTIRLLSAYAFACGEENAANGVVVTAPTCGSCGVIPSILRYFKEIYHSTEEQLIDALAIGGLIGNLIKTNGSISGAEAGCQAEIGSATAMGAAMIASLRRLSIDQIEYASEVALEHTMGLTCDPVLGYVQIPCIERNAIGATKAASACEIAQYLYQFHQVGLDTAIKTAYATGKDLSTKYRETSTGGLADYVLIDN